MRIILIFFLSCLVLIFFSETEDLKAKQKETEKELIKTKSQLKNCRKSYKLHMEKCAMISTDQIQKRSGRYIVLYSPQNTQRQLCSTEK